MQTIATSKLCDLPIGGQGNVLHIAARGQIKKRILEMGLTTGTAVEVKGIAPMGDPMDLLVKGYHLSLRKKEAELVEVELYVSQK